MDLEEEYEKWVQEFGEESAGDMKRLVEVNMEGYENMKAFKL